MIDVTVYYAAAIAILMAVLSARTGFLRGKYRVALGDGGNHELALAIRRFGNLSEYAAMAIVLLLVMELKGVSDMWLHAYGATLLLLRLVHPLALFDNVDSPLWRKIGRFVSAIGTALLLVAGSIAVVLA